MWLMSLSGFSGQPPAVLRVCEQISCAFRRSVQPLAYYNFMDKFVPDSYSLNFSALFQKTGFSEQVKRAFVCCKNTCLKFPVCMFPCPLFGIPQHAGANTTSPKLLPE